LCLNLVAERVKNKKRGEVGKALERAKYISPPPWDAKRTNKEATAGRLQREKEKPRKNSGATRTKHGVKGMEELQEIEKSRA